VYSTVYRVVDQKVNVAYMLVTNMAMSKIIRIDNRKCKTKKKYILDFCVPFQQICKEKENYAMFLINAMKI
jgi:hypothetical protein